MLAFWAIYVLTRPLGASIGDFLSQPTDLGGLGLGATVTSLIFVIGILALVGYLSVTKADVISAAAARSHDTQAERGGLVQTAVVVVVLLVAGVAGYFWRSASLEAEAATESGPTVPAVGQPAPGASQPAPVSAGQPAPAASPLGDLSSFRTITQDTLNRLQSGDQPGATTRIGDLEIAWDNAEARLKPRNKATWTEIDDKIDTVLRELRATSPDPTSEKGALNDLLGVLG